MPNTLRYFSRDLVIQQVTARLRELTAPITELAPDIWDKVFVAGGAITALVHDYPVVDVDIYFRNSQDIAAVKHLLKANDHHIYTKEYNEDGELKVNKKTFDVYVEGLKYQFIIDPAFIGMPVEVLGTFDFTVVQNYFDGETLTVHDDVLTNSLILNHDTIYKPEKTLQRLVKYRQRGFKMDTDNYIKLIQALRTSTTPNLKKELVSDY